MKQAWYGALALLLLAPAYAEISFNQDIRPILSDNCFYCHGPDEKTREADLRLDTFEGATRDLDGYAAIVPGQPDKSALLHRVTDHEDRMPPPKSKKILTDAQVKLLHQWIAEGAEYESHWAFMPLQKKQLPEIKRRDWPRNPIDHFVLARLEAAGIAPSPEADRSTLIRRAYLDLTGLLPTPEELAAFLADERPDAYERLVDSLLASPHYGERWGRHWLDQARYADSHGYSVDGLRQMWPYRDWVIKALNDDMPFDQFTIEQLAGDLLPNPTKLQQIATGFHRNTLINQEGGSDREQFRVEAAFDRVATTGAVWLGLTLGCAQCHSHKFDPISQREFFEFYAFFNSGSDQNSAGKTLTVQRDEVFGLSKGLSEDARSALRTRWEADEKARLTALLKSAAPAAWQTIPAQSVNTSSDKPLKELPGHSYLLQPGYGLKDAIVFSADLDATQITGVRLRVLPHESLPSKGPGTAGNGNFVLTGFEVSIDDKPVALAEAFADHEQKGYGIAGALDPKSTAGWAINSGASGLPMNAPHDATFVLAKPVAGRRITIRLRHDLNDNYLIGHFAIDITDAAVVLPQDKREVLHTALSKLPKSRSKTEEAALESRFVGAHPEAKRPAATHSAKMMIMDDLAKPRDTYLLTRGDFTRPDKALGKLHPGALSQIAPPLPAKAGQNRLDLARWLVDARNPLTPRVTMNRVWMRYFGRGLVETEEDFGTQGTPPSHPALLDWLGATLIEGGWSLKAMHRLIVNSATYRQRSHVRPDLREKDPQNYLLARQSRIRVDAELVRDAALCASGLLTRELGGPGVYPPQPAGVYAFTQTRKGWNAATGRDRYRRAMYTTFYRSAPYPLFTTFDAPDFSSVCTRRVRSNTPLQALNVANDPVFVELAQALASRLAGERPADRIDSAFRICLSRSPSDTEAELLSSYLRSQQAAYADELENARQFAGQALTDTLGSAPQAAALVALARVMFNTDNFITRE